MNPIVILLNLIATVTLVSSGVFFFHRDLPPRSLVYSADNSMDSGAGVFTKCLAPNTVALTYDDGPNVETTPKLLDLLKAESVKATFFVLGERLDGQEGAQRVLKRAFDEGHVIGSHTYSHNDLTTLDSNTITQELSSTEQIIHNVIGKRVKLMRPPYGSVNEQVVSLVKDQLGYQIVNWNLDSRDWQLLAKDPIVWTIRSYTERGMSYLVLFHDIHAASVDAQYDVIKRFKSLGYRFVTVDECLGLDSSLVYGD